MSKDVVNHFVFPKFTSSYPGTLREGIYNDKTTRDKISLNWLKVIKFQSISVSMMMKTVMEVTEDCTIFNYGPPRSQK